MTTYRVDIEVPESISRFFDILRSHCGFSFDADSDEMKLEFEVKDEWELAQTVHELADELRAYGIFVTIDRPKKVT